MSDGKDKEIADLRAQLDTERARADKAEARAEGYEQALRGVADMRDWAGRFCGHCRSTVGRLSEVYDAIDAALNSKDGE